MSADRAASPAARAAGASRPIAFTPDELDLTDSLRATYAPYILVEPTPLHQPVNARWPSSRWQGVIAQLAVRRSHTILQPWHEGSEPFAGAVAIPVTTFRESCAILAGAQLYVGMGEGLTHAAAALDIPAVVLYHGVGTPKYPWHTNLMGVEDRDITVNDVVTQVKRYLAGYLPAALIAHRSGQSVEALMGAGA